MGGGRSGKGLDLSCVCLRLERGEGAGGEGGREGSDWLTSSTTHMVVRRFNGGEVGHRLEGVMRRRALPPSKLRTDTLACRQFLRPTELVFEEIHPQTWDWFTGVGT